MVKRHEFKCSAVAHEKSTKFKNLTFKIVMYDYQLVVQRFLRGSTLPDQNRFSNKEIILNNINISV